VIYEKKCVILGQFSAQVCLSKVGLWPKKVGKVKNEKIQICLVAKKSGLLPIFKTGFGQRKTA
jgi:hypothetical protein